MSGQQTGAKYVGSVERFLRSTTSLPLSTDGTVNMTELARQAGVPKQSLYKNPNIRSMLHAAMEQRGVKARGRALEVSDATESIAHVENSSSSRTRAAEQRVHRLEQQNAALVAENAELRRQLKALRLQMGREDMAIETGRRIAVPEQVLK
jgi:hypothetical protein